MGRRGELEALRGGGAGEEAFNSINEGQKFLFAAYNVRLSILELTEEC